MDNYWKHFKEYVNVDFILIVSKDIVLLLTKNNKIKATIGPDYLLKKSGLISPD